MMLFSLTAQLYAQQAFQFTQFNFDKLWFNPAYAGNNEVMSFQAIAREQWLGFEGAPSSQSISAHSPFFGRKVGLGIRVDRDALGPVESINASTAYAYRIFMPKGTFSIGLQASVNSFRVKHHMLNTLTEDNALGGDNDEFLVPNFGFGVFYKADKFFFGGSIPNLMRNNTGSHRVSEELLMPVNSYLTGGRLFKLNSVIDLQPSFLMRFSENTPLNLDLHASLIFMDKIYGGMTYTLGGSEAGESLDLLFQIRFNNGLRIGASYDYTLSNLQNYNDGSVELMLQYLIIRNNKDELTNPRFF